MSRPGYLIRPVAWRAVCEICNDVVFRWHRHSEAEVEAYLDAKPLEPVERMVAGLLYQTGVNVVGRSADLRGDDGTPVRESDAWQAAYHELERLARSLGISAEDMARDLAASVVPSKSVTEAGE